MLGHSVEGFEKDSDSLKVLLKDVDPLKADMVILAIGVAPDTHLAKDVGLKLGIKNSIVVNDHMETSVPDIYAVGDAVEVHHMVTGQQALISWQVLPTNRAELPRIISVAGTALIKAPRDLPSSKYLI